MKADRRLGIPGTNHGEWGDHLCVFYQGKEDLLSLVVPYIRAGLEDNEFCMWITGRPINEYEAFQALEAVVPEAHRYLADRQLEILPHSQWYLSSGVFDAQVILDNWTSKARHAQSKGFAGIRITGNPFWLHPNRNGENSDAMSGGCRRACAANRSSLSAPTPETSAAAPTY